MPATPVTIVAAVTTALTEREVTSPQTNRKRMLLTISCRMIIPREANVY